MLVFYSDTFLGYIGTTLFPSLQRAVAREEAGDTRWLFLRTNRLRLICGLLPLVGMIVFAQPFIRLWMLGPQFDETAVRQAAVVMQILAGSKLLLLFVGASNMVLSAMGRVRLTASMVAVEATLNLALSLWFVLAFGWGLAGIAGGTLAARLLVGTFIVPWHACAAAGVPWRRYLLEVGGLGVVAGGLFAAVCLAVRTLLPGDTWPWFFGQVALATALYAVLAYALLVPPSDRRRLRERLCGHRAAGGAG
jgi:O-antigen/teichoic acid export membrane protein